MRHAHANLLHAKTRTILQDAIERREKSLSTFDAEPLHAKKPRVQKLLESLHFHKVPQHPLLGRRIQRPRSPRFNLLSQPVPHPRILDVHVFKTNLAGVNRAQFRDHVPQFHRLPAEEIFRRHSEIEVLFLETQLSQCKQRMIRRSLLQRVRPCVQMPERAVTIDEAVHSGLERAIPRACPAGRGPVLFGGLDGAELEALEESSERGFHGKRVALPAGVRVVENVGVETGCESNGHKSEKGC